jgi:tRNA-splicing ligase RtcB
VLDASVGLPEGVYLALLSHSGSRGTGAQVADHYSRLARDLRPELPRELTRLAWLDLETEPGQQYWAAMELMGRYAAANHAVIHKHVVGALGAEVLLDIENHHNFAWRERHRFDDGSEREVIVHRKGATPAGPGAIGVIPGSMATPGYVVRGKGGPGSLDSASHGAGRRMSRVRAKQTFRWDDVQRFLRDRGVTLISAGLDEVPMAYKDIDEVMGAQRDLVDVLARFDPRLVKMAPGGEPPED